MSFAFLKANGCISWTLSPLSHNILARLVSRIASSWAVILEIEMIFKIWDILILYISWWKRLLKGRLLLPIVKEPAWLGSSYQNLSPKRILLNWSPTRHLKVGPKIASLSFLSNSPPIYKSKFSIDPYNCCNLGTNCKKYN